MVLMHDLESGVATVFNVNFPVIWYAQVGYNMEFQAATLNFQNETMNIRADVVQHAIMFNNFII